MEYLIKGLTGLIGDPCELLNGMHTVCGNSVDLTAFVCQYLGSIYTAVCHLADVCHVSGKISDIGSGLGSCVGHIVDSGCNVAHLLIGVCGKHGYLAAGLCKIVRAASDVANYSVEALVKFFL